MSYAWQAILFCLCTANRTPSPRRSSGRSSLCQRLDPRFRTNNSARHFAHSSLNFYTASKSLRFSTAVAFEVLWLWNGAKFVYVENLKHAADLTDMEISPSYLSPIRGSQKVHNWGAVERKQHIGHQKQTWGAPYDGLLNSPNMVSLVHFTPRTRRYKLTPKITQPWIVNFIRSTIRQVGSLRAPGSRAMAIIHWSEILGGTAQIFNL